MFKKLFFKPDYVRMTADGFLTDGKIAYDTKDGFLPKEIVYSLDSPGTLMALLGLKKSVPVMDKPIPDECKSLVLEDPKEFTFTGFQVSAVDNDGKNIMASIYIDTEDNMSVFKAAYVFSFPTLYKHSKSAFFDRTKKFVVMPMVLEDLQLEFEIKRKAHK